MSDRSGDRPDHWFEPIADHLGSAYLRYSFTKGTTQEVDKLINWLDLSPGDRVLDVGCGPGRHSHELARRGITAHGVDISQSFIDLATTTAPEGATFERCDARSLPFDAEFDAAIALCQGGFGLLGGHDTQELSVLRGLTRAVKPGGRVMVSAFSAYFSIKYQTDATFDAATGVAHEHTEIRDPDGKVASTELWTTCFTPRELRLLAAAAGLTDIEVWSSDPGHYRREPPTTESSEYVLIGRKG